MTNFHTHTLPSKEDTCAAAMCGCVYFELADPREDPCTLWSFERGSANYRMGSPHNPTTVKRLTNNHSTFKRPTISPKMIALSRDPLAC
jgi:hypothetical protein